MKRLFTFGCSFTHYHWPTWADILGKEFDYFENWGQGGSGNLFILNSLNECVIKRNITSDDTVIIKWTDIYRNDTYNSGQWVPGEKYQVGDRCYDDRGYAIRDLGFINSARIILDYTGCNYYFLSMVPISTIVPNWGRPKKEVTEKIDDIFKFYKQSLDLIKPSIYETVFNKDWNSRILLPKNYSNPNKKRIDFHASTEEHLEYLDLVLPEMPISDTTRNWVKEIQEHITQDPQGQDPFDTSTYRPWVWSFGPLWTWKQVKRL